MDFDSVITETRHQRLLRSGAATPRFLQGVYPFAGRTTSQRCTCIWLPHCGWRVQVP